MTVGLRSSWKGPLLVSAGPNAVTTVFALRRQANPMKQKGTFNDDSWALIGEDTPFFLSGQSWYQVLWTSPKGGDAYYILAHHYIAATLNILNGTLSSDQVNEALDWADENFFNTYTPSSKLDTKVRKQALYYADLLDQYNNGYIGPRHCSE